MTKQEFIEFFKEIQESAEKLSVIAQREECILSLTAFPDGYVSINNHDDKLRVISLGTDREYEISDEHLDTYLKIERVQKNDPATVESSQSQK